MQIITIVLGLILAITAVADALECPTDAGVECKTMSNCNKKNIILYPGYTCTNQGKNSKKDTCCGDLSFTGCPKDLGFFDFGHSSQCFKFFKDDLLKFDDARRKCEDHGLRLAHPYSPVVLREQMIHKYGDTPLECWVGGQRDGNTGNFKWLDNKAIILSTSSLWFTGQVGSDGNAPRNGLVLLVNSKTKDVEPNRPYFADSMDVLYRPLCEIK